MAARKTAPKAAPSLFVTPAALVTGKRGRKADESLSALMLAGIAAMGDSFAVPFTARQTDKGGTIHVVNHDGNSVEVTKAKALGWAKQNGRKLTAFGIDANGNLAITVIPAAS